jgi:hypothetical protein
MFASLNIWPCCILIIDEILCVLLSCSFSRFAHSADSSMLVLLVCYNQDVENTHLERFLILVFLMLVSRLISQNNRRKKEKRKEENYDDDGNKTTFLATKE